MDVGDDLGADLGVEVLDESGAAHGEFLAEDGGFDFDVEGLVADEGVADVAGDAVSEDFFEGFDEAELVVGCFEPFLAEEVLKDGSDMFCVAFTHGIMRCFRLRRGRFDNRRWYGQVFCRGFRGWYR